MKVQKWIKPFFIIAGLYDGILGIIFLIVPLELFKTAAIAPPNHIGYVQFPALLLIVIAVMFFNIAKDPIANRNLILYGILVKISYCLVVFPHWLTGNIPSIWIPFAFFDLGFLVMFFIAGKTLKQTMLNSQK
ncbi:MAG: hypothetical protein KAJ66_03330 [Candidatus Omnitrophica bacterium]|nr:hypothetical protein [Candidatus Omnitrophota bacterium]